MEYADQRCELRVRFPPTYKPLNLDKLKLNKMKRKKFIKEHILPYEDDKTKVDYYEGRIDYDNEYLEEVATSKNIKLK